MKLASRLQSISEVDAFLLELKEQYALRGNMFFRMLVSVNEAITNAIVHGNKKDPAKWVTFDYSVIDTRTFIFSISDEGDGFDWAYEESRVGMDIGESSHEGGRGLLIMDKMADRHVYNNKGNSIVLYFIREHAKN